MNYKDILDILDKHSSLCLDDEEERHLLALAISGEDPNPRVRDKVERLKHAKQYSLEHDTVTAIDMRWLLTELARMQKNLLGLRRAVREHCRRDGGERGPWKDVSRLVNAAWDITGGD